MGFFGGHLWFITPMVLALFASLVSAAPGASPVRERIAFNADWRFAMDDPADTAGKLSYTNNKALMTITGGEFSTNGMAGAKPDTALGADVPYTQPAYDDSGWRKLNLPHDFGIEGPFKQEYPGDTGKLPWWGVAWYRKHFTVPASDKGRQLVLNVDGAMSYASVWINGQFVGGWPYGYASWQVDLTPHIQFGAETVIMMLL